MKIKTNELINKVNNVYKAVGNNKIIPITQMIGIKLLNGVLTLCATDSFNYFYVNKTVDSKESIDVCVNADILSKLVNKFTCEETELILESNYLLVSGNGKYKLDLLLDDEGKTFKFPTKEINIESAKCQDIDLIKFTNLKFYAEKSLATTMEEPDLIAYYVNNELGISTDRNVMTLIKEPITDTPLTLRPKFVELMGLMKEQIKFYYWNDENSANNQILLGASDGETTIFSKVNGSPNDYPYESIKDLIETTEFGINAKISTKELLSVLDRINLMVTPYDSNTIDLKVSNGNLFISSVKSTGVEVVSLKDVSSDTGWEGKIDIEMLRNQLVSFNKEVVDIYFGNDTCIKLVEDRTVKLICLVEME